MNNKKNENLEKIAFTMNLKPGFKSEYKKRHDEIWPELVSLLRETGIRDYSIFLDEEKNVLFAVLYRLKNLHVCQVGVLEKVLIKGYEYF